MGLFEQFRHTQAHHDVTPPLRLCSCDRQPHSACLCVYPHWIQFSFNEYKSRGSSERLFQFSSAQSSVRLCLKRNMEMGEMEQNNYF